MVILTRGSSMSSIWLFLENLNLRNFKRKSLKGWDYLLTLRRMIYLIFLRTRNFYYSSMIYGREWIFLKPLVFHFLTIKAKNREDRGQSTSTRWSLQPEMMMCMLRWNLRRGSKLNVWVETKHSNFSSKMQMKGSSIPMLLLKNYQRKLWRSAWVYHLPLKLLAKPCWTRRELMSGKIWSHHYTSWTLKLPYLI